MTVNLPASILNLVEMHPVEDIASAILREGLPDLADDIVTLVPLQVRTQHDLLILVRRVAALGEWAGDDRFIDHAGLMVHVYAGGLDADERAALTCEAVRVVFRDSWMHPKFYPGLGTVKKAILLEEPIRRTDWMPTAGPVQYADLPADWTRYEMRFDLYIRRPV